MPHIGRRSRHVGREIFHRACFLSHGSAPGGTAPEWFKGLTAGRSSASHRAAKPARSASKIPPRMVPQSPHRGHSPRIFKGLTAGRSPASHRAAKPARSASEIPPRMLPQTRQTYNGAVRTFGIKPKWLRQSVAACALEYSTRHGGFAGRSQPALWNIYAARRLRRSVAACTLERFQAP